MEYYLTARIVLLVVLAGAGVLIVWMARAAATGRLKRNPIAGIRVPSTMASDEAWLAAHVRAKRPTELAGYISAAGGLFALLPVSMPVLATGMIVMCVAVLGFVLYGARVGSRAAAHISDLSSD